MTIFLASFALFGLTAGALALGARSGHRQGAAGDGRAAGRTCAAVREAGCFGCAGRDRIGPATREPG